MVEDNDINQTVLRRQLESVANNMFAVTIASNGLEVRTHSLRMFDVSEMALRCCRL